MQNTELWSFWCILSSQVGSGRAAKVKKSFQQASSWLCVAGAAGHKIALNIVSDCLVSCEQKSAHFLLGE